jgi:hypothetical protein
LEQSLQDDGLYLIDDGVRINLYIGKLVPDEIKPAATCSDPNTRIQEVASFGSRCAPFRRRTAAASRASGPHIHQSSLTVIVQRDGHQQGIKEAEILSLMVNDTNAGEKDYVFTSLAIFFIVEL